jgi:hypothetical protein
MKRIANNVFFLGRWQDNLPTKEVTLMIADPVYGSEDVRDLVSMAVEKDIPSIIFMWPDDVWNLPFKPEQLLHWIKPESTKNTIKRYSRFIEVMACYGLSFTEQLHWSNRTGIFTDRLFRNDEHAWKKPESLIERLIRNHWPGRGIVYDPCAGSRTVERVCKRLKIDSISVDIVDFKSKSVTR